MTRPQFKVRLDNELDAAVRGYAAARNVTMNAVVHAALKQYLSHASPYETTMKRLDRLSSQLEQQRRILHLLAESLASFVHLWLGHTPAVHPEQLDAARSGAQARYRKWIDHVARRLSGADSFFVQFAAKPLGDPADLDLARQQAEASHA